GTFTTKASVFLSCAKEGAVDVIARAMADDAMIRLRLLKMFIGVPRRFIGLVVRLVDRAERARMPANSSLCRRELIVSLSFRRRPASCDVAAGFRTEKRLRRPPILTCH